ncbi:MAG: hypothetical protein NUW23_05510 [Firmicutes bacterium]|nr:hypothetical protein [Bacillota bacterium]
MIVVPETILRRLYVPGSLENTDSGFQFRLRNSLARGTLTAVGSLVVDGAEQNPDSVAIHVGEERVAALEVSPSSPVALPVNVPVTVSVVSVRLSPGHHEIHLPVVLRETGPVELVLRDSV